MIKRLKGVVYSDIHLGHRNTPTIKIIEDLKTDIMEDIKSFKPNILFIAGDLFDRHLPLTSDDSKEAGFFLAWLLSRCKKNNILVRLLEGTPSHDWKQGWLLNAINESPYLSTNAKWISELSIEYIPELDINVLYIPDEWSSSTEDTKHQVIELLEKHNLEQVDITCMHGMFPHQIPAHVNAPVHDYAFYEKITSRNIFCGHVHKYSEKGKLIVPGSHPRLAHGEEDPKGHIRFDYSAKSNEITFVENVNAQIYKTIDCTNMSNEHVIKTLTSLLTNIPEGSHVRIRCKSDDVANVKGNEIISMFPGYFWKMDVDNTAKEQIAVQEDSSIYRTTPITDVTINSLVEELMKERGIDDNTAALCMAALNEVKGWIHRKEK